MTLITRPTPDRKIIRDPATYHLIRSTLGTNQAAVVPFNSDSNTARALRARFWREGLRLRVVKIDEGYAAWLEAVPVTLTKRA